MKKVWILGIIAILLLAGCTLISEEENTMEDESTTTDEDAAVKVVKDYVDTMWSIYEKHGDDWEAGSEDVKKVMEEYIYFDDSLSNYSEGIEGAKDWAAGMIYGHIDMWNATETFTLEVDAIIENPTDVPTSLRDDVEAVASMTIASGDATGEAYAVKIDGKWYVEAIGWDDGWFTPYPWEWFPEFHVGSW